MLPTIAAEGEVVLVDKLTPQLGNLQRGQVIVACSPNDPDKLICKRIVGMPGDQIVISTSGFLGGGSRTVLVPSGQVWIEGDNPHKSLDSREFGPLPMGLIRGRALCKVQRDICNGLLRFGHLIVLAIDYNKGCSLVIGQ